MFEFSSLVLHTCDMKLECPSFVMEICLKVLSKGMLQVGLFADGFAEWYVKEWGVEWF
jgi:hypothetical protein